ncbi:MAG: sn-glycerol-3-phosphate ABC transporter ATP-binding protein UgpC [Bacteroidetes bacterium]|jgi:multiple sugar transport system ATP-binding protein|nr:sn-glycerol-3-phosphate ABC transporter ATP-binding protein UgpC [Bacteroidota bacterium]
MASVRLEHVKKVYEGDIVAVHDFSLDIQDKEFVVLVGPSGCGKSTTLRMVAGLEDVTAGTISIDGQVVNDVPPKDRDIAMVFQNYALYPHMTVYENMGFGLKLRKFPKDEIDRRVQEAASILGIGEVLERKPKALSGGQRQRVAVGRAIVRKPKVFLFDEPLSNLDAKLRVQMRTEISRLHQRLGATMIYVTHDQTEAMTMADRIVLMKDGRIQQVDSPLGIYSGPTNKFTAGFIGSPAMNFFEGRIQRQGALSFRETGGPLQIKVPKRVEDRLKPYIGQEIVLGIRPEHLTRTSRQKSATVKVTVDVVEPMGNEVYVYFVTRPGGSQHVARLGTENVPERGKSIDLSVDVAKILYFDKRSEEVL